jgi:hypothetical protein
LTPRPLSTQSCRDCFRPIADIGWPDQSTLHADAWTGAFVRHHRGCNFSGPSSAGRYNLGCYRICCLGAVLGGSLRAGRGEALTSAFHPNLPRQEWQVSAPSGM